MASTGSKLGGAVNDPDTNWVDEADILVLNDSPASPTADNTLCVLELTNFAFSIPAGQTIDAIEVKIEAADSSQDGSYE